MRHRHHNSFGGYVDATQYANDHRAQNLGELEELLRIPSISTLPEHTNDMQRAADWLTNQLRGIEMTKIEMFPTAGHPVVFASWLENPRDATILVYGPSHCQP